MRATIQDQSFLGGQQPNFADFAVAGAFVVCTILCMTCAVMGKNTTDMTPEQPRHACAFMPCLLLICGA